MNTVGWVASKRRVAIHEVGHVVVEYLITGQTEGASICEVDGVWHGVAHVRRDKATALASPQIWQEGAAIFYGGWAAVNVAIATATLDDASLSVEQAPGDHGFVGAVPADQGQVEFCASHADPADIEGSIARARDAAMQIIKDNLTAILELANVLEVIHCILQPDVEKKLGAAS